LPLQKLILGKPRLLFPTTFIVQGHTWQIDVFFAICGSSSRRALNETEPQVCQQ
jgi:hypothetical protein